LLVRVGTGDPTTTQIMYGIGGERRLTEFELPELPGSEASGPVRVGKAASEQFQLDVYGDVVAVMFIGAEMLGRIEQRLWPRWRMFIEHVETIWRRPDDVSERRGPRGHFTYSKVMALVVFDRAVRLAEQYIRRGTSSLHAVLGDPRGTARRGLVRQPAAPGIRAAAARRSCGRGSPPRAAVRHGPRTCRAGRSARAPVA
jgi:Glycosyl hydrolases family 15